MSKISLSLYPIDRHTAHLSRQHHTTFDHCLIPLHHPLPTVVLDYTLLPTHSCLILPPMNTAVILPAAGSSQRFGKTNKLEADLAGRAVLTRAVELFSKRPDVSQIIVAAPPDDIDAFKFKWHDKLTFLGVTIVPGGRAERWETVHNALAAIQDDITHVAVHDAARPVTDPAAIDRVFDAAQHFPAVIPAVPVAETLKRAAPDPAPIPEEDDPLDAILGDAGKKTISAYPVTETVSRTNLHRVQTPQLFERTLLESAYQLIADNKVNTADITDDAGLVEALGRPVHLVPGDPLNIKITQPQDLPFAAAVLQLRTGKAGATDTSRDSSRKFPQWKDMDDE